MTALEILINKINVLEEKKNAAFKVASVYFELIEEMKVVKEALEVSDK